MPKGQIYSKTGDAQIKRQGQTSSGKHGTWVSKQPRSNGSVKDLKAK